MIDGLTEEESRKVEEAALERVKCVWEGPDAKYNPLVWSWCSGCSEGIRGPKKRVISFIATGEALCASCWYRKLVGEMAEEVREQKARARFDAEDFARL